MRACRIVTCAGGQRLENTHLPIPQPSAGEVLIRVSHAGLNRADIFQTQGSYPLPEETDMIPGLEVAGVIVATGEGVRHVKKGDAVCALLSGGGYAEYCLAPAGQILPVPAGLGLKEAASLPEALATVWLALVEIARLGDGERVLIHGGSSGVGLAAIQLARLLGARVFATAGSAEKCRACEALGAIAIAYRKEDFVIRVKEETGERGVDVVLDMVGGSYVSRNIRALAYGGRMVSLAFLDGAVAEVNMAGLMMKNLIWSGMTLRSQSPEHKAAIMAALADRIWPEIAAGRWHTLIDRVYPLEEAEKAQKYMQESLHIGKILLSIAAEIPE